MIPTCRRHGRLLLALVVGLLLVGGPVHADPAGPTPYESRVVELSVDGGVPDGVAVRVFGGDSYLVLSLPPGVTATVPGYDVDDPSRGDRPPESYLRFDADGSVFVNLRSRTHFQNAERYGVQESALPGQVDPEAPPDWEQVASDGTFAWHDHRIHWMTPDLPTQVSADGPAGQEVLEFAIPLTIDGRDAVVRGELRYTPPGLRPLALVVALAALVGGGLLALRGPRAAAVVTVAGGVVAVGFAAARALEAPAGADLEVIQMVLPVVALLAGIGALVTAGRGRAGGTVEEDDAPDRGLVLAGLAGVGLVAFGLLNGGAFTQPQLPTDLPFALFRTVVAAVTGIGTAAVAAALRDLLSGSVSLGLPALDDEVLPPLDEPEPGRDDGPGQDASNSPRAG